MEENVAKGIIYVLKYYFSAFFSAFFVTSNMIGVAMKIEA